jgi:RHH-type proline utilization regulon transcriptional repressor/proline dehydrogenase/delta 1-pyrroline-5-carboxylate dehydrogenase
MEIGQQIFRKPRLDFFSKNFWFTKMIELATQDPRVKTQLFRFVDVLPVLKSLDQKRDHLLEYLSSPDGAESWPTSLRLTSSLVAFPLVDRLLVKASDFQVRQMARNFILGAELRDVLPRILERRSRGLGFTLDILGEAVLSDDEAQTYQQKYLKLIAELGRAAKSFPGHPVLDQTALGPIPAANISIKISSLDCRMDAMAFEDSLRRLCERLEPIVRAAVQNGIFVNFDLEQFSLKELTRELFKRLISKPEFRSYRHFGIVVQAYLQSSMADVCDWIQFARDRKVPFTIRLVKGAYWDYEVIHAHQNGWEPPVFLEKYQSDENFEACARALLEAYPAIELAAGTHNVRSISYVMATAEDLNLPKNAYEIQMLYGMADSFKAALVPMRVRVREYDPVGDMLPGLSYFVRRLLENSSNDSFLNQSFLSKTGIQELLRPHRTN